ncbi:hypothetical protein [Tenuibacillus multivorans]|uniref:Uncharacterized protein n=1 Tax=Tenuibacillus multivorans TaxID=237069 RepID=A0A1G9W9W2_9BACI|nr:hypothetical protein [Tenuibacillus multivorans]GEL76368.1 hypothetical protein TMU01_06030 [Tenuibacillus multivorans]SDM81312.1 hypothetical protein SAMN05216498_0660 [Tenuibacillus multivorans]
MQKSICELLENIPPGTQIEEIMVNGEDVSKVEELMEFDPLTGLVYFTNSSNNTFVANCQKIDMIEFKSE